jgi:DNA-directed RNA polymerase subunit RPC12/RpoP
MPEIITVVAVVSIIWYCLSCGKKTNHTKIETKHYTEYKCECGFIQKYKK